MERPAQAQTWDFSRIVPGLHPQAIRIIASPVSVHELESAVARLTPEELSTFSRWFEEYVADRWDREIEKDMLAGRFGEAGAKATSDFEANRCTPL